MVIKETGVTFTPFFNEWKNGDVVTRRFLNVKEFHYTSVIWHDGFKLAFGSISGLCTDQLIEVSTGAKCAGSDEVKGKGVMEEKLYKKFLEKLKTSGKSLGELVEAFNEKQGVNVKTWQISLLNM